MLEQGISKVMRIALPDTLKSVSGVAFDAASDRIFVADQATGSLTIVDTSGKVISSQPTAKGLINDKGVAISSGALNVAFDPVHQLVYVANPDANNVTVYKTDGTLLQTIDSGTNVNHVEADGRGNVYVVNKGGNREGNKEYDLIQRLSVVPTATSVGTGTTTSDSSASSAEVKDAAKSTDKAAGKASAQNAGGTSALAKTGVGVGRLLASLGAALLAAAGGAVLWLRRSRHSWPTPPARLPPLSHPAPGLGWARPARLVGALRNVVGSGGGHPVAAGLVGAVGIQACSGVGNPGKPGGQR